METSPEILTLNEAAAWLQVSPRALREATARGEVPGRQVCGKWRFSRPALHAWLSGQPRPTGNPYVDLAGCLADNPLVDEVMVFVQEERLRQRREAQREVATAV